MAHRRSNLKRWLGPSVCTLCLSWLLIIVIYETVMLHTPTFGDAVEAEAQRRTPVANADPHEPLYLTYLHSRLCALPPGSPSYRVLQLPSSDESHSTDGDLSCGWARHMSEDVELHLMSDTKQCTYEERRPETKRHTELKSALAAGPFDVVFDMDATRTNASVFQQAMSHLAPGGLYFLGGLPARCLRSQQAPIQRDVELMQDVIELFDTLDAHRRLERKGRLHAFPVVSVDCKPELCVLSTDAATSHQATGPPAGDRNAYGPTYTRYLNSAPFANSSIKLRLIKLGLGCPTADGLDASHSVLKSVAGHQRWVQQILTDDCLPESSAEAEDGEYEETRHVLMKDVGTEPMDVVVDMGHQTAEQQRSSFELLFPLLRPGGLFFLERTDVHWRPPSSNEPSDGGNRTISALLRNFLRDMHGHGPQLWMTELVASVECTLPGLCVVVRADDLLNREVMAQARAIWPSAMTALRRHDEMTRYPDPERDQFVLDTRGNISAIVVVYNDPFGIMPSLLSIEPFVAEIVVVDHGSTDLSTLQLELLRIYFQQKRGEQFYKLLRVDRNTKHHEARNLGIDSATREFVLKWDADFLAYDSSLGDNATRCWSVVMRHFAAHVFAPGKDWMYYRVMNYHYDLMHTFRDEKNTYALEFFIGRRSQSRFVVNNYADQQVMLARPDGTPGTTANFFAPKHPYCATHFKSLKSPEHRVLRSRRSEWFLLLLATNRTEQDFTYLEFLNSRSKVKRTWSQWVMLERQRSHDDFERSALPLSETQHYPGPAHILQNWRFLFPKGTCWPSWAP